MRKTLLVLLFSLVTGSLKAETLFLKPGSGFGFGNGYSNPEIILSVAGGVEESDGFSFYPSAEQMFLNKGVRNNFTFNVEYKALKINFLDLYVFSGLGLSFFSDFIGRIFQIGLGLEINLTHGMDFFAETKYFDGGNDWWSRSPANSFYYFPIVGGGLKFFL